MQRLIFVMALAISFTAQASFLQDYCGNADGSVQTASGHVDSFIQVKKRTWDNGQPKDEVVKLDYNNISWAYSEESLLQESRFNSCDIIQAQSDVLHGGGQNTGGVASWQSTYTSKLVITPKNGFQLSPDYMNYNRENGTIETLVICTSKGNSRVLCSPQPKPNPADLIDG